MLFIYSDKMGDFDRSAVSYINTVRSSPSEFAGIIERDYLPLYKGPFLIVPGKKPLKTQEGEKAVKECIDFLKGADGVPELKSLMELSKAAYSHCNDIGPKGLTGHTGSDNSNISDRIEKHLEWNGSIAECITYEHENPLHAVVSLLVDDGFYNRPNRKILLNSDFKNIGISSKEYSGNYYCVIELADGSPEEEVQESPELNTFREAVLKELNEVRANPVSYVQKLATQLAFYDEQNLIHKPGKTPIQTQEGRSAVMECIQSLGMAQKAPELELSSILSRAAQDHCNDIGPKGITGHDGSDGSSMSDRIEKHGSWDITIGENIDFGNDDPSEIVMALLIDDGVPNRGHRENIMNPQFRAVGIGFGAHTVYRHCCTMDFAGGIRDNSLPSGHQIPSEHQMPSGHQMPGGHQIPNFDEMPEGAVGANTYTKTYPMNGATMVEETKVFTFRDGSTQTMTRTYQQ